MATVIRITGDVALLRKFDNLSEAVKGKTLERGLVSGALMIQNPAKENAPVLTGNLRRSIHIGGHEDLAPGFGDVIDRKGTRVPRPAIGPNTVSVFVGTDVTYAAAVEYGTGRSRAQPYLRPALDQHRGDVVREVAGSLRDLIRAAIR